MSAHDPLSFEIDGMTCAACVGRAERAIAAVAGVERAAVKSRYAWRPGDFGTGRGAGYGRCGQRRADGSRVSCGAGPGAAGDRGEELCQLCVQSRGCADGNAGCVVGAC